MRQEKIFSILSLFCILSFNIICINLAVFAESYRLTLNFGTPRRYSSRFDKQTRTLQIKIIPARAEEFKNTAFYDTRYIQRIIVKEKQSEVLLNIQLKNFPMSWMIATQEQPWRILVDFWKTEEEKNISLEKDWNWQPDILSGYAGETKDIGLPMSSNKEIKVVNKSEHELKNQNKKLVKKVNNEEVVKHQNISIKSKKYDLPDIYSRLELIKPLSDVKKAELQKQIGNLFGSQNEFTAAKNLAEELYLCGQEENALTIFRKLAALNEDKFKQNDKLLWQAGESAFLTKNFDIANDYFKTLLVEHPGSQLISFAKLRVTDIEELLNSKNKGLGKVSSMNEEIYANLALADTNQPIIKIAASLRNLDGVVDERPEAVKLYQQNLDTCVNSGRVPFDLLKNCAYDRNRYLAENDNIIHADIAVQQFKKLSPLDSRSANLEKIVQGRVKVLLSEIEKSKDWPSWVDFEKKVRPALLTFSFNDSESLFTRAMAFEEVGENKKSIQLYETFLKSSADAKKKNESAANASLLLYKTNEPKKANELLKKVEQDTTRKTDGFSDRCIFALRELSIAPYSNKIALNLLVDEVKLGRYEERNLSTLSEWSKGLRGKPQSELIYEKILAYPVKSPDEVQIVESSIMQYANDLRDQGRFAKSGDMFFAISNLSQGTHRAEAAYKAGVVYARAGLFDKAKSSWLLAANDTNDKRYSSLANERLDRINK